MFNKNDIIVIRKVHVGLVLMKAEFCEEEPPDNYLSVERLHIDIIEHDSDVAAFSNIEDCTNYIRKLYNAPDTKPSKNDNIPKEPAPVESKVEDKPKDTKNEPEINVPIKNTQIPHVKSTKKAKDKKDNLHTPKIIPKKKEVIGYMCDSCGETYEVKLEKCNKCNSYSIDVLEKDMEQKQENHESN